MPNEIKVILLIASLVSAFLVGYVAKPSIPSRQVAENATFIDKPGQAIKWIGIDDRQHCLWINGVGKGVEEVWLKPNDPDGLKPLSDEELKRVQDEMRRRKNNQ